MVAPLVAAGLASVAGGLVNSLFGGQEAPEKYTPYKYERDSYADNRMKDMMGLLDMRANTPISGVSAAGQSELNQIELGRQGGQDQRLINAAQAGNQAYANAARYGAGAGNIGANMGRQSLFAGQDINRQAQEAGAAATTADLTNQFNLQGQMQMMQPAVAQGYANSLAQGDMFNAQQQNNAGLAYATGMNTYNNQPNPFLQGATTGLGMYAMGGGLGGSDSGSSTLFGGAANPVNTGASGSKYGFNTPKFDTPKFDIG